jgi:uncharacterized protein YlxW (UPF0749 family)
VTLHLERDSIDIDSMASTKGETDVKLAWRHTDELSRDQAAREDSLASGFRSSSPSIRVTASTVMLTVFAVALGIFFAAQFQTQPQQATTTPEYRREVAASTIQRLEAEQADLKRQIAEFRAAIVTEQKMVAATKENLSDLSAELQMQKVIAGLIPLQGPGLRILLDDSAVQHIPVKEDPSMYIVHEYQLRDIVNVLWGAGAEAISINGERLVESSSIYCVGSTILVNDTRTSPPYEFVIIGDSDRLHDAIAHADNLKALKSRIKVYGLQFQTIKEKNVTVPAFGGSLDVRHVNLSTDVVPTREPANQPKAE